MSTSWYAKLDAGFHSNRKARKAGLLGRAVFVFTLCQNAARGGTGSIPEEDLEPWYIAEQLQVSEDEAREGVERAVAAGLIAIADGRVEICGWNEDWGKRPLSDRERQQRRRDKNSGAVTHGDAVTSPVTNHEPRVTRHEASVTNHEQRDASRRKVGRDQGREGGRDRGTRAVARRLSPDFRPCSEAAGIATGRGLNLGHELAQFRDHAASSGKTSRDWEAEFRKWLRGSEGRGAPAPSVSQTPIATVERVVTYQRMALNPNHFYEVVDGEPVRVVERAEDGSWRDVAEDAA